MRRQLGGIRTTSTLFAREYLRSPLTLGMLITLPAVFVIASASVLGSFATALGGNIAGHAAVALGAGWSAAFMAGALGFFQTVSSRGADRRLAWAGLGALSTALARLISAVTLCALLATAALIALRVRQPIPHFAHTALGVVAFAMVYLGIGTTIGVLVDDELAGSLAVVFVFMLDVFSGPGMATPSQGLNLLLTPSRFAGELLIRAGGGLNSPTGDWRQASMSVGVALAIALGVFWFSARPRA